MQEGKSVDYDDFFEGAPNVNEFEDDLAMSVPSRYNSKQDKQVNGAVNGAGDLLPSGMTYSERKMIP